MKPRNISELMHRFANGYRENCVVGNVSIQNNKVYSYRLPICTEIDGIFVLHYADNSPTTNGHIAELRGAIHGKMICVSNIEDVADSHRYLRIVIEDSLKKASTARTRKESILVNLARNLKDFNAFSILKGSNLRFDVAEVIGRDLKQIAALKKEQQKQTLARPKAQLERNKIELAESLSEWRTGGLGLGRLRSLPCALRLRGNDVQTSYGADITIEEAKVLWKVVQRAMKKHNDYEPGIKVGHYFLNRIRANGNVVIGCHNISYSEMEGIAKQLELI